MRIQRLVEKLRPDVLGGVNHSTNFDAVGLHTVKDQMRLKAESSIARRQFVDRLPDEREIGEKPKRADQPSVVGFSLIDAKFAFSEIVDVDQVGSSPLSKPVLSHGGERQLAAGRRLECRRACL